MEVEHGIRAVTLALILMDCTWDFDTANKSADTSLSIAYGHWKQLYEARDQPHDGDCTDEAHICLRCRWEKLVRAAEAILKRTL